MPQPKLPKPPKPRAASKPHAASKSRAASKPHESNTRATPKLPQDGRNSVRIIGGGWRGRRVSFPDLPGLRPTPDRVRETLFNWLQHDIAGTRCLDLFAGSGALGLEALSRGAADVVFVEQAQAAARSLVAELARLGGTPKARVVEMGASRFLRTGGAAAGGPFGGPFDVVFMDPPFGQQALTEYIPLLDLGGWVKPGGLVYLESEKSAGAPGVPAHWQLLKSKSAGEVGYHLARVNERAGDEPMKP
ncbi:MAG TPA: 16S rRNA (guanine(966)-N(2))-methyltransferase RsmD [Steroidobacteraceae bacterium]|nr:16S rRNA (guanine(966)-N(2))-methyltransferase RsmD [Steroidobacteraceae bacterium]